MTDTWAVAMNRDHDEEFDGFYRQQFKPMVARLTKQGVPERDAEDAVQAAMLQAHRYWPMIIHPRSWVPRVAYHSYFANYNNNKRRERTELKAFRQDPRSRTPSQLDPLEEDEENRRVMSVLQSLPAAQAEVLTLKYNDGLTPQEIAKVIGKPPATVRSLLRHACNSLRDALGHPPSVGRAAGDEKEEI